nr:immunoglobulin heavy chain junction region [Macaca mulatta]MOV48835.1 immunoglobulin heavy chain junction region [Macaca mulatta]MOV49186.1 immunoglobulin heavy chain junction region [Macaca mulatta]MOV49424.1 immunoglobulin heavy chain junction region [Macaca mulatta]MOV50290.1 immunoglobulin heavy chain junction region [Macaca mulatta]
CASPPRGYYDFLSGPW